MAYIRNGDDNLNKQEMKKLVWLTLARYLADSGYDDSFIEYEFAHGELSGRGAERMWDAVEEVLEIIEKKVGKRVVR